MLNGGTKQRVLGSKRGRLLASLFQVASVALLIGEFRVLVLADLRLEVGRRGRLLLRCGELAAQALAQAPRPLGVELFVAAPRPRPLGLGAWRRPPTPPRRH